MFSRLKPLANDRLSRCFVCFIIGFIVLLESVLLIPWLPQYYETAIQSQLHQLGALAEAKVLEKQNSVFSFPDKHLPEGSGFGIFARSGQIIWHGDDATITAARSLTPIEWCDDFSSKLPLALSAIFTSSTAPQVFRVNTGHFDQLGAHTPSHDGFEALLIVPSNVVTSVLRSYILNNFIFALFLALCISLPFTYLFNRLVLRPVQSIKRDMMDFANSIDPAIVSANSAPTNSVIDQAQETFNDVRASTQQKIAQQDKLATMGEVVAKVNHDMRNVLSSALLVSDRLSYSDDPKQQKSAVIVQKSIDRASTLCRQMTDYIKALKALKPEWLEIAPILRECGEDLSIDMSYEGPEDLYLDGDYFYRLLHNLGHNAKKAGADQFTITVHQAEESIIIDCADNGPGMPQSVQARLFTPFTTSSVGSIGLGLCIAREAALIHGGDLQLLKSDSSGTTFRLHLPPISVKGIDDDRYQIKVFSNDNIENPNCCVPVKIEG